MSIDQEYKDFSKWCRDNPAYDLDPRLHTHSGRINDGGYISHKRTGTAFKAWQASRQALEEQGYLNERAQFAEKDAKLLDEMAEELRSLNWAIEACGRDGKIEYEKACQLAKKVIKAAANYL